MNILQMNISATIIILAIIFIRTLTMHKLPKKMFLALWFVAVFRLFIPLNIPLPMGLYTPTDRGMEIVTTIAAHTPTIHVSEAINIMANVINIIWIAGVIIFALLFALVYVKSREKYLSSTPLENDFINNWLLTHKLKRCVHARQSDRINTPITFGIFKPIILFPKNTQWVDEHQLQFVLTHELMHIKRFDIVAKWLLTITLCIHWFNPFVWVMYWLANRDIEFACDEAVVTTFGDANKLAYAKALIGMEERKHAISPLYNHFAKNAIEERIRLIMKKNKRSTVGAGFAALVILLIGVGTFVVNAQTTKQSYENPILSGCCYAYNEYECIGLFYQEITPRFFSRCTAYVNGAHCRAFLSWETVGNVVGTREHSVFRLIPPGWVTCVYTFTDVIENHVCSAGHIMEVRTRNLRSDHAICR